MATLLAEPPSLSSAENAENVFPREGGSASRVPNGKWSVENKCDGQLYLLFSSVTFFKKDNQILVFFFKKMHNHCFQTMKPKMPHPISFII